MEAPAPSAVWVSCVLAIVALHFSSAARRGKLRPPKPLGPGGRNLATKRHHCAQRPPGGGQEGQPRRSPYSGVVRSLLQSECARAVVCKVAGMQRHLGSILAVISPRGVPRTSTDISSCSFRPDRWRDRRPIGLLCHRRRHPASSERWNRASLSLPVAVQRSARIFPFSPGVYQRQSLVVDLGAIAPRGH